MDWGYKLRIAGVDPDTKSITIFVVEKNDLYRGGPETTASLRLEAKGRKAEDRFLSLVRKMHGKECEMFLAQLDYAYVERPFVGPNRKAAIDMGMVVGAFRAALERLIIPHSLVDPAVWKTNVLGTSRVSKEEIKQWAMVRFGLTDDLPQDTMDAACIATYGMTLLSKK